MTDKPNSKPIRVSKAPPPITPLRGSSYISPKKPEAINWAHWQLMPIVELQQAVALSVSVNPDCVTKANDVLIKRMKIALSHVDAGSLLLEQRYANQPMSPVSLSKFAAWAVKLNITDLPPEFVAMALPEPTATQATDKEKSLADREFSAAFAESVNNDVPIDWRYWIHELPRLTTAEAARLMSGLDPDRFKSLESRPNNNDQSKPCKQAAMIQRLAERAGKESATPNEWLAWADERKLDEKKRDDFHIKVHDGFRLAVESAQAQTTATASPVALVSLVEPPKTEKVDKGWVMKKAALIDKHAHEWGTIKSDFHSSSENGLSKAAKAPGHGEWFVDAALNWADQRGKRTKEKQQALANSMLNLVGKKHTLEG